MNDLLMVLAFPPSSLYEDLVSTIRNNMISQGDRIDHIRDIEGVLPLEHVTYEHPTAVGGVFKGDVLLTAKELKNLLRIYQQREKSKNSYFHSKRSLPQIFLKKLNRRFNDHNFFSNLHANDLVYPRSWIEDDLPDGMFISDGIEEDDIVSDFKLKFTRFKLDLRKMTLHLSYEILVMWDGIVLDEEPLD